jgi:hypothetical protein
MLWNGNESGKNYGNENLKATITNKNYDRSKNNWKMWNISIIWVAC